jgi:hypothetical protein
VTYRFGFAVCTALGVAIACEGGELDAFTSHAGSSGAGRGGTSTGGSGGTLGGTFSFGGEGGEASELLPIDDFEDGNRIAILNKGEWFVSNDGTGNQTLVVAMPAIERENSTYSLHTSGVGFQRFSAVVCDISGTAASFDASAYAAVTFWARAEPGASGDVLFSFFVGSVNFATPLHFGTTWDRHTILFADALPVEDPEATFDPRAISSIQFNVARATSFDFWLDDLAFVR